MSKQILNQRYTYKINSSYLQRHKWNIEIKDIRNAIKNRFIVGTDDSTGTRIIRELTDKENVHSEEYINEIKLKKKRLNRSKDTNKELTEINNKLYKALMEENLCNVVFSSEKQYDYASDNGFVINGHKYVLLLGTSGGIKSNTVLFCKEDIHEELLRRIFNGVDKSIQMMPSKLMAYMALIFSSSTPVTNTKKVLVVKDVETSFKSTVTKIKFNDELNKPDVIYVEDSDVTLNACDGCSLISPELAKQWSRDLKLDYETSAFCVRNSWLKGMLTSFDFKKYCREVIKQEIVTDVWGKIHNINDIDIILNESMLKCWHGYDSVESYLDNCDINGYTFSVTKSVPKTLENKRTLNYQYLQCLNLSDKNIEDLIRKDVNEIKDVIGLDYRKTILFGKGTELNNKNVWINSEDDLFIKSLMIDKSTINDEYVKYRIRKTIEKRIKRLKTGKIKVDGNYQIAIGEPIIQLESMFGLEPKGLLVPNEFFIKYWLDKDIKQVGGFRSPMSCKSNARKMNICNREEVIKWYGGLSNLIVFNAWDTSMMAFNGEDFDADMNFTTSDRIVTNGIYDEPAIDCEGKTSKKKGNPTREDFVQAIKKAFGNKVGGVTNVGSACYDKISLFEEGSKEYEELDYRIKCIQFYQQECIDSAKNGEPPKPIPSHWNNFRDEGVKYYITKDKEVLDTYEELKLKDFNNKVLTDKKPYYFIYIYDETMKEYNKFIKDTNTSCARRFRCKVSDLKSKEYKTDEEIDFLKWYDTKNPVSCNPCIVNKVAWLVEDNFDKNPTIANVDFDHTIYQLEDKSIGDSKQIKKIKDAFQEYKNSKNNQTKFKYFNKEDICREVEDRDTGIRDNIEEIIPDRQVLLNTLIHLSYDKSIIGRWMVWLVVGDLIIENMLDNNNRIVNYPQKNVDGNIEYDGYKFTMVEKYIAKEDKDGNI